jgi:hypothetical protein
LLSWSPNVLSRRMRHAVAWRPLAFLLMNKSRSTRVDAEAFNDALMHCLSAANHLCKSVWPRCILCPPASTLMEQTLQFPVRAVNREKNYITLTSKAYFVLRNTFPSFYYDRFWILDILIITYGSWINQSCISEISEQKLKERCEVKWGEDIKCFFVRNYKSRVGSEVLTAAVMKSSIRCDRHKKYYYPDANVGHVPTSDTN